jgi:GNAT superfamily N-acetyltransferase
MIEVNKKQMGRIAPLFEGIEDSMVKACLQGYMGNAYVRTLDSPKAALIVSGEYSFFGGDPHTQDAAYLTDRFFDVCPSEASVGIFADNRPEWGSVLMSCAKNHPAELPRFGIAQKDYDFDKKLLQGFADSLPKGFELAAFDEAIYAQAMAADWSREFCETFASAEDYLRRGFGLAALADGELVSGASTMTVYDGGCELQVATHEKYRQRGLAMACSAAMILECVRRGIRPCWDAANLASKKMALKLGYEYRGEYLTIQMRKSV